MMYQQHVFAEVDPEHYLGIPNEADACHSYKAEYDSKSDSGIQRYEITMPSQMPTKSPNPRDTRLETTIHFRINTESTVTNRYGIQQSHTRLVVDSATIFKSWV